MCPSLIRGLLENSNRHFFRFIARILVAWPLVNAGEAAVSPGNSLGSVPQESGGQSRDTLACPFFTSTVTEPFKTELKYGHL